MPARLLEPFTLAAILQRHSPRDLLIFGPALARRVPFDTSLAGDAPRTPLTTADVAQLGKIRVGSGSLRRAALVKRHAPEVDCVGVRGNVDTRLRKLAAGEWDALILAEASLDRLGITSVAARPLDPAGFVPCAAQGALAIEMRRDHPRTATLQALDHRDTRLAVTIERELLARLGGDCTMPFGCLVEATPEPTAGPRQLRAHAIILAPDGDAAEAELTLPYVSESAAPEKAVAPLHEALMAAGAARILRALGLSGQEK
jgi:hydroxymethylbilane synthase